MTDDRFIISAKVDGRVLLDDRLIEIETRIGDKTAQTYARIIDTEDQMIREGLIRLGWTPPKVTPAQPRFGISTCDDNAP